MDSISPKSIRGGDSLGGCEAAIAVSSMVAEMAKGKDLEEAKQIRTNWWPELGGLPAN
jgi:NifU-like protein involved in Fe-S cluster formation